jgi:hypothetical protein
MVNESDAARDLTLVDRGRVEVVLETIAGVLGLLVAVAVAWAGIGGDRGAGRGAVGVFGLVVSRFVRRR